jgi:hypothetical protein
MKMSESGKLIYDGALSDRTMYAIRDMMKSYPNVVEMTRPPTPAWIQEYLPEYDSTGEDCMGREYPKRTRMYGIVWKNFHDQALGCFVFTPTRSDMLLILTGCCHLVVNEKPFRSVF